MIAFKWLSRGAVGPFTRFRWTPGEWVKAPVSAAEGTGIHACRIAQLPWWVADELWLIELDGLVAERETQVEGRRGRLLDRVQTWDPPAFAEACAGRAAAFAAESSTGELAEYAAIAREIGAPAASSVAAVAAVAARGTRVAFAEERAWQAQWLQRALGLSEG